MGAEELHTYTLPDGCVFFSARLPAELTLGPVAFEALWDQHPSDYHLIKMHGRTVATPRWQQAYGNDYHYTGRVNAALPITPILSPFLAWSRAHIDERLNGLLLNWYDAELSHYIGRHRDSTKNLVQGSPIVTISLGAARVFRLRPWRRQGFIDFPATDGTVFVLPYATNLTWTHEVPHTASARGRRISITARAFAVASPPA